MPGCETGMSQPQPSDAFILASKPPAVCRTLEEAQGVNKLIEQCAREVDSLVEKFNACGDTRRLGVFGGTFDPIHNGHLRCAEEARQELSLDALLFVPDATPVFKKDAQVLPAAMRFQMCAWAVADNPCFFVDPIEVQRGGDSRTIDTLRILRSRFARNVELYFITGADAFADVLLWKDAQELLSLAHFVCVCRPGTRLSQEAYESVSAHASLEVYSFDAGALDISASRIRELAQKGDSLRYLVPDKVACYIAAHKLYRDESICDRIAGLQ